MAAEDGRMFVEGKARWRNVQVDGSLAWPESADRQRGCFIMKGENYFKGIFILRIHEENLDGRTLADYMIFQIEYFQCGG